MPRWQPPARDQELQRWPSGTMRLGAFAMDDAYAAAKLARDITDASAPVRG